MPPTDEDAPLTCTAPTPLIVHSGGTRVATDELLAHLPQLEALAADIETDAHRLAIVALGLRPGAARTELERAERAGYALADRARGLRTGLLTAAIGYENADRLARTLGDVVANWLTGASARGFVMLLPWWSAHLQRLETWTPGRQIPTGEELGAWLAEHPEVITSPEFVDVVRRAVTGADDAVLGLAGVPPVVALLLGDYGLGVLPVGVGAAGIVTLAGRGGGRVLTETPVTVQQTSVTSGIAPARTAAERLDRVPSAEQVRIERFSAPGRPDRFMVYVAPTQTFSPVADGEPWDLTSNIAAVGGLSSGSMRATEQAMQDAGITAESEVVLVGYSQGGLVADALAASGNWNTVGLETYGDPGGGIDVPEGITGFAARHTDDLVPATGGPQQSTDRMLLERRAFAEGAPIPTDLPVPAHQKRAYAETAVLIDAARSPEVRAQLEAIDAFTADYTSLDGAEVTMMSYQARRTPAGGEP